MRNDRQALSSLYGCKLLYDPSLGAPTVQIPPLELTI